MVEPNKGALERVVYKIEAATGTKVITAAGDTTYSFGGFLDAGDQFQPDIERVQDNAHSYNSREVASGTSYIDPNSLSADLPNIIPTMACPWNFLLGTPTDAAPDTIQVKDSGLKKAITFHSEHNNGTNPMTRDLVGAYVTGLKWRIEVGEPLIIDNIHMEGHAIEDEDSSTASIFLTNAGTDDQAGKAFYGINEIKWDTGGDNETLTRVYRVDFDSHHAITSTNVTGSGADASRTVYPGKFGTKTTTGHTFIMSAVLDTHLQYDDKRAGNSVNVTFKSLKADGSDYIKFLYTGVEIVKKTKAVSIGGGYSLQLLSCKANTLSLEFDDGVSTFATWYS